MTRSKIAYVYCEECDYSGEYELPMSMEQLGGNLESNCADHAKTGCKAMLIAAGSPKDQ